MGTQQPDHAVQSQVQPPISFPGSRHSSVLPPSVPVTAQPHTQMHNKCTHRGRQHNPPGMESINAWAELGLGEVSAEKWMHTAPHYHTHKSPETKKASFLFALDHTYNNRPADHPGFGLRRQHSSAQVHCQEQLGASPWISPCCSDQLRSPSTHTHTHTSAQSCSGQQVLRIEAGLKEQLLSPRPGPKAPHGTNEL